jgi:hypothetical protein
MMEMPMIRLRQFLVRNRKPAMAAVVEARTILCAVPQDTLRGESRGVWLQRVAAFFGLSHSEAVKIYYRRKQRMDADKLDAMRDKLVELRQSAANRQGATDAIKDRLADLRSAHGGREAGRDRGGAGTPDGGSLGAGEGRRR